RVIRGIRGRRQLGRRRPGFAVVGRGDLFHRGNFDVKFLPDESDVMATRQQIRSGRPPAQLADRYWSGEMLATVQRSGVEQPLTRLSRGEPGRVYHAGFSKREAGAVMRAGLDLPI